MARVLGVYRGRSRECARPGGRRWCRVGEVQEEVYGRFGWFVDPDGNKVELWQPPTENPAEAPS